MTTILLFIVIGAVLYWKRDVLQTTLSGKSGRKIPLIQFMAPLILIGAAYLAMDLAEGSYNLFLKADSLRKMETYAPLLGEEINNVVKLAQQSDLLPSEFDRTPEMAALYAEVNSIVKLGGFCFILAVVCAAIQIFFSYKKNNVRFYIMGGLQFVSSAVTLFCVYKSVNFTENFLDYIMPGRVHNSILMIMLVVSVLILGGLLWWYCSSFKQSRNDATDVISPDENTVSAPNESPVVNTDEPEETFIDKYKYYIGGGVLAVVIVVASVFYVNGNSTTDDNTGVIDTTAVYTAVVAAPIPVQKPDIKQTAETEEDARAYVESLGNDAKYIARDYQVDPDNGDNNRVFYLQNGQLYLHDFLENKTYDYKEDIKQFEGNIVTDATLYNGNTLFIVAKKKSGECVVIKENIYVVEDPELIAVCSKASFGKNGIFHIENYSYLKEADSCEECSEDFNLVDF